MAWISIMNSSRPLPAVNNRSDNANSLRARLWNHNIHYHDLVLRAVPPGCRRALDVGCGQGLLARRLAQNCQEVTAIDTDRDAISRASVADGMEGRLKFVEGDVMTYPFSDESFELITAVATLHHLELRPALARFRQLLSPGGVLAIIGLYRGETFSDRALAAAAFPASWMFRLFRGYADVGAPVRDPMGDPKRLRCHLAGSVLEETLVLQVLVDVAQAVGLIHWFFLECPTLCPLRFQKNRAREAIPVLELFH